MEVKIYRPFKPDRPNDRPTNQPTNRQTARSGHRGNFTSNNKCWLHTTLENGRKVMEILMRGEGAATTASGPDCTTTIAIWWWWLVVVVVWPSKSVSSFILANGQPHSYLTWQFVRLVVSWIGCIAGRICRGGEWGYMCRHFLELCITIMELWE